MNTNQFVDWVYVVAQTCDKDMCNENNRQIKKAVKCSSIIY